jgi:hypothetical protein
VAADAVQKRAAARQQESRMLHQTRDSLVSRLSQTEQGKGGRATRRVHPRSTFGSRHRPHDPHRTDPRPAVASDR